MSLYNIKKVQIPDTPMLSRQGQMELWELFDHESTLSVWAGPDLLPFPLKAKHALGL